MNFEKRHISLKKVSVPASGTLEVHISGRYLRIKEATAVFQLQTDNGEFFDLEKGLGFGAENHPLFTSLFFKNLSSADVLEVVFYVSNVPIDDARVTYVAVRPGRTYLKCIATTVNATTPYTIPNTNLRDGKAVADSLSHVIITASGSTSGVYVKDAAGIIGGLITHQSPWQVATLDALTLIAVSDNWNIYIMAFYNYDS